MGKAQVSMEYLLISAFAFLIVLPLIVLFSMETSNVNYEVTVSQVHKIGDELISSVNSVYYLGEPSKKSLRMYIPKFVENISFSGNKIIFLIDFGKSTFSVIKYADTNVSGNISSKQGAHSIEVIAQSNQVYVSE